ncbi:MAG: redoxin domain-containing protein [Flavobacteriales bacterium]|nr:redoxin domain-containing protein [Flavobacteriales bacterium]
MKTIILSLCLIHAWTSRAQVTTYPIGSTVNNFITLDTEGNFHELYAYTAAGKTVMLDFFFYDCVPCQDYAPDFSELYSTYGCNQGGIVCFHVNSGVDSEAQADQFVIDFGGEGQHPPVITPFNGGLLVDQFGVGAFPTLCVIAPDNTMWNNDVWPISLASMEFNFPEGAVIKPMSCSVDVAETATDGPLTFNIINSADLPLVLLDLPASTPATLHVADQMGRCIVDRDLGTLPVGSSSYALNDIPAHGTYIVRLITSGGLYVQRFFR